jgi:zinc finger FYVE domain-containing protein 1
VFLTFHFSLISSINFVRTKCTLPANHQKENIPHHCNEQCSYNKELDNEIFKCLKCHREGRDTIVYGKLSSANDSLVEGIVKYVWSGFVIECSYHGEIYRSRKYWYGNNEPKDVTRVEVIHIWPGDGTSRLTSDVTPRKVIEVIRTAGRFV